MPHKKNLDEKNALGKRAARYVKVTASMAGVGARVAGKRAIGKKLQDPEKALLLRAALGGLKGPLMKVAQLLGTIPDLVPKEYADVFATLQSDAPSMGAGFVRRRMRSELGPLWESRFHSFEGEAAFAASLGQVHRAVALDGTALACKLQYPDMMSTVEADLRQLKIVLAVFERFDRAVDTREVFSEIADRLREELDYLRESHHMKLYETMLRGVNGVVVPVAFSDLSTDRLLTMTWLEGDGFIQAADTRCAADRNAVALNMFRAWYTSFYKYGIIHGDPHFGNYTIRPDHGVNLLDFGCVRIFEPELVQGVMLLYQSLLEDRPDLAVAAYELWGFKDPSRALIDILNVWARFLYAPLLEDKARPIEETNTGVYGRETARKIHQELRKIGGVTVPRAFVFMDRAAVGLGAVFLRLGACVNWYREFHDLTSHFDVEMLRERQACLLFKDLGD